MNSLKKTTKKWRLNYVIAYLDANAANVNRRFVQDALIAAASLRKIDYAIEENAPVFDEIRNDLSTYFQGIVADLVYFRSSSDSLSSIKEFREIVDSLSVLPSFEASVRGNPQWERINSLREGDKSCRSTKRGNGPEYELNVCSVSIILNC